MTTIDITLKSCSNEFMAKQKSVTPTEDDIVNQSNDLSRASYTMPVIQRRLIFLAMAQVRDDDSTREFSMPVAAVLRALGMSDDRYREIRTEVDKVFDHNKVSVDTPKGWKVFTWITEAEYIAEGEDVSRHTLVLTLNRNIVPYARTLKKSFHQFRIADIAKLQGRHALRIFELICSNMGLAGKGGNKPGEWFFDTSIADFRRHLGIHETEYPRPGNLRVRVIDAPVEEINRANLGLRVTVEYGRNGKFLTSIRFLCKLENPSEPKAVNPSPATESEKEALKLRKKYAAEWDLEYQRLLKEEDLFGFGETVSKEEMASAGADKSLLKRYGSGKKK